MKGSAEGAALWNGAGDGTGVRGGRRYKYYDLVMAAFVTVLVCSNFIGAAK